MKWPWQRKRPRPGHTLNDTVILYHAALNAEGSLRNIASYKEMKTVSAPFITSYCGMTASQINAVRKYMAERCLHFCSTCDAVTSRSYMGKDECSACKEKREAKERAEAEAGHSIRIIATPTEWESWAQKPVRVKEIRAQLTAPKHRWRDLVQALVENGAGPGVRTYVVDVLPESRNHGRPVSVRYELRLRYNPVYPRRPQWEITSRTYHA